MKKLTGVLIVSAMLIVLFSGCKKEEEEIENNSPSPTSTLLKLFTQHAWNGGVFEYDREYQVGDVPVKFTEIRYYLSNFTAMNMDMSAMTDFDEVLLVDAGVGGIETLGSTDLNHLHMLSYNIGLDSETNHQDPTTAEAPLNDPMMHWSWNPDAGYKFIKIEGEHDANDDGIFEAFAIHVATDAMLQSVSKTIHTDISGSEMTLFLTVNLEDWFTDVDFMTLTGTHGGGETAAAVANASGASMDFSATLQELMNDFSIMFHHDWGSGSFEMNQTYTIDGTDVKFSEIRYYLSNFMGMDDAMNQNMFSEVLLMNASEAMSTKNIGEISLAHLHMLNFVIGLDDVTNHQDPTIADPPLNDPLMHWSWNPDAGYKFIKVEGEQDADGDGTFEAFSIHVATDNLSRDVSSMIHQNVNGDLLVHCHVDLEHWFNNLDFGNLSGTHGDGSATNSVADGAQSSFAFE